MFGERGFKDDVSAKLEFDLTESERNPKVVNRQTLDWSTFTDSGFGGRETFSSTDLIFRQNISAQVKTGPSQQQRLTQRLRETEAMLPAFPYDTTAQEIGRIQIDALFFEAWADVLVSGGWARDELKESNFALLHWKARGGPRDNEVSNENARYCLVEEIVPVEYRDALVEGKQKKQNKRISFMRAVRRTNTKKAAPSMPPAVSNYSYNTQTAQSSLSLRPVDASVFAPGDGATKQVSLGANLRSANGSFVYVPSVISSTGAGHGHDGYAETIEDGGRRGSQDTVSTIGPSRGGTHPAAAIPGTITSQRVASPQPVPSQQQRQQSSGRTNGAAAPVGYTKPPQKTGLFSRLGGGTKKKKASTAPAAVGYLASIEGSPSVDGADSDFEAVSPSTQALEADPMHHDAQATNGNGTAAEHQGYPADSQTTTPTMASFNSPPAEHAHDHSNGNGNDHGNGQLRPSDARLQGVVDRSSAYSQASATSAGGSPYTATSSENGYDEDDPALQIGTVMFRGSLVPSEYRPQSHMTDSFTAAEQAYAQAHGQGSGGPQQQREAHSAAVPDIVRSEDVHADEHVIQGKPAWLRPARNVSLAPDPARAEEDEEDVRLRYTSGASQYSSRVKGIIGLYENRGESDAGHGQQ